MASGSDNAPLTAPNLRAFFHESLQNAVLNQHIDTRDSTIWYLTNLLADFARTEQLFDDTEEGLTLRPLAGLYAVAAESGSEHQRKIVLRRLGDVALFISGLFSGLFTAHRCLIDADYYIAMGGSAYGYLGDGAALSVRDQSMAEIFSDLSRQFVRFVDVLAEVGEHAAGCNNSDLLRTHELWLRTKSPRLEKRLRTAGIIPVRQATSH